VLTGVLADMPAHGLPSHRLVNLHIIGHLVEVKASSYKLKT